MKENIFSNYVGLYPVSKTLRFSLIPMFETDENIKKYGILERDNDKADNYHLVKDIFDNVHKKYVEKALGDIKIQEWDILEDSLLESQREKNDAFDKQSEKFRKNISKQLKSHKDYKSIVPKEMIGFEKSNNDYYLDFSEEEKNALRSFARFATYFQGYKENRENIYGDKQGSISYRIINENFPKYLNNIKLFNSLPQAFIDDVEEQLKDLLKGTSLNNLFSLENYGMYLTQSGIDFYNSILGGIAEDDTHKTKGFNEFLNLGFQQNQLNKKIKFNLLYKQILSEKSELSFIPKALLKDSDIAEKLTGYHSSLLDALNMYSVDFREIFFNKDIDLRKVFVDEKQIPSLSQLLFDNQWGSLRQLMYDNNVKKEKYYDIELLQNICEREVLNEIYKAYEVVLEEVNRNYANMLPVIEKNTINGFDEIKSYLDSVQKCEKILKIISVSPDLDKEASFYSIFESVYNAFRNNITVYNMVRNYATKKPYSVEKFKLNFDKPTLADGWDQNKQYDNNAMLFMKDDQFYLGILNEKNKPRILEQQEASADCYKKMVYKLLPGPNKMLPKVFFSTKGIDTFKPNNYILEGYEQGKHKKGDNFELDFCHELIDFFKESINKHKDWSKFGFEFSDTKSYKDISEFYKEITEQGYSISFSYVDKTSIENMVKEGELFLFHIYNKDFSPYSKGSKNLHTLYWKELFSVYNLKEVIFKLNGEAELFYRPASIENPFIHKKGSVLISKTDIYKNPLSDEEYEIVSRDAETGMSVDDLKKKYPNYSFKVANYDIVKDKRYSQNKYFFHVPITINYGKDDHSMVMNKTILEELSSRDDVNVIGVDRGERNLIYISVIDRQGKILKQKSFNIVENDVSKVNYHKKLDNMEKSRDAARKNWKNIDNIKEMKEGFLSAVIKEIADLMIEYNAIVVLEDLNFGFKRGRFHIEKQVYQKFEKMLIDKLNYFADKNLLTEEYGSIRYGYQLTPKFDSFQKLGKQSGFLFYVPASYTSKIDPTTGFVNLFTSRQLSYQSVKQAQDFFEKFISIEYDKNLECFSFRYKYSDFDLFKTDFKNEWKVYSYGEGRLMHSKENGYDVKVKVNVTERLKELFKRYDVDYLTGDLKEKIISINDKPFYSELLWLFKAIVQLRYEDEKEDFILSPVYNNGEFFDSRKNIEGLPCDGDANGAYHIALQGLRLITERISNGKILADKKGEQSYAWFKYVQERNN